MNSPATIDVLLQQVQQCLACQNILPHAPKPILQAHAQARILIVGQAPGIHAHMSGKPWDDASGRRLREWLGLTEATFYDPAKVAILPMGFCYPGKAAHGDLPPTKACYPLWHQKLIMLMPALEQTLLVGAYAQAAYLGNRRKPNLTLTVKAWREYLPRCLPLPHPSPLNNRWLYKNKWFMNEALPSMRQRLCAL